MVVATALEDYPTSVVSHPNLGLVEEAPQSYALSKEELSPGRRVAVRKPTGELILAQMAGNVDRKTVQIRPELDSAHGTYGLAEFIDLNDETVFHSHPQEHLPGIDYQAFLMNAVPKALGGHASTVQERLF